MAGTVARGRYASVTQVSSSGALQIVNLLGNWEVAITFDEIEASSFGTTWKKNLTGMSGWSGTASGFLDVTTDAFRQFGSSGVFQKALTGTVVQDIRLYLQSSSGLFWMPAYSTSCTVQSTDAGAYISNIRNGVDKAGLATLSFSLLGYGAIALFQANSSTVIVESTG